MSRGFLALWAISLIAATAARAQISAVDPSNTYIVRTPKPVAAASPEAPVVRPREVAARGICPSNTFVRMEKLVCAANFSDVLATPERFYGLEINIDGYLIKGTDGLLLLPFAKPAPGPYETIHVQLRPSNDPRRPPIPPRLLPKLENGSWVRVVGTLIRREGALKSSVGVLTDAHEIADISDDLLREHADLDTYLPDLRLKHPYSPSAAPPQFEIAP